MHVSLCRMRIKCTNIWSGWVANEYSTQTSVGRYVYYIYNSLCLMRIKYTHPSLAREGVLV